jgi:hypothetical protein
MSGWTVITVRGKEAHDYEYTRCDSTDPWDATSDVVATMEDDERVHRWTTWSGHVYAYLACSRYDFEFAEEMLEDYGEMVEDAVVLGANDTSDQGTARYYPRPDLGMWTDQYEESDHGMVGERALRVIAARHGIIARDPFHNRTGRIDNIYLDSGVVR